jgi:hypothetical protein
MISLVTRIQDFSFTIAGVIMIAYVSGKVGLRELSRPKGIGNVQTVE